MLFVIYQKKINIVDEVFEDANFEAIMHNDKDALSEDSGYNSDQSEDQNENSKSKIAYPAEVMAMNVLMKVRDIFLYNR